MPAPSLTSLCTKVSVKNVKSLTDVGDFEYWKIREVLLRVSSPQQLRQIELASPQICGEDAELWKVFITRDIPDWKRKNYAPKNPKKWYEVYMKYLREQKEEIERDKLQLKESMMGLQKKKESNVSKVVDAKHLPKLPKDPRMLANNGGVPLGRKTTTFAKTPSSVLSFSGGSKTKMTTGSSVLLRARREAKEMSARNKLVTPTHQLANRSSRVYKAPQAMLDAHRKAAEPEVKIFTSKRPAGVSNQHGSVTGPSLEERERRLRALTMSGRKRDSSGEPKPTLVGSDDEDDEDDGIELDDLFSDTKTAEAPPAARRPISKPLYKSRKTTSIRREPIPKPLPSSSRSPATKASQPAKSPPKPSALISAIISKKESQPSSQQERPNTPHQPSPSSATPPRAKRRASPLPARTRSSPQPLVIPRKRPEVDIFNRGGGAVKKPRIR